MKTIRFCILFLLSGFWLNALASINIENFIFKLESYCGENKTKKSTGTGFCIKGVGGVFTALHTINHTCKDVYIKKTVNNPNSSILHNTKLKPSTHNISLYHDVALLSADALYKNEICDGQNGLSVSKRIGFLDSTVLVSKGFPTRDGLSQSHILEGNSASFRQTKLIRLHDVLLLNKKTTSLRKRKSPNANACVISMKGGLVPGLSGAPVFAINRGSHHLVGMASGGFVKMVKGTDGEIEKIYEDVVWAIPFLSKSNIQGKLQTFQEERTCNYIDIDDTSAINVKVVFPKDKGNIEKKLLALSSESMLHTSTIYYSTNTQSIKVRLGNTHSFTAELMNEPSCKLLASNKAIRATNFYINPLSDNANSKLLARGLIGDTYRGKKYNFTVKNDGENYILCTRPASHQPAKPFIIDNAYGLMWSREVKAGMTWQEARRYANNASIGGYHNWRLPTKAELKSFVKFAKNSPDIQYTEGRFWTGEKANRIGRSRFYTVNAGTSKVLSDYEDMVHEVRLVRSK